VNASPGEPTQPKPRVVALLTSFNRREQTLAALAALFASHGRDQFDLSAVLVDDGSSDGTADAVRARFPQVVIERGDGSLYWCRGMNRAFAMALEVGFDYYFWLNDDTLLFADALIGMLTCERALKRQSPQPILVIGSTIDAATGVLTYGGARRPSRWRPLHLPLVTPGGQPEPCDTLNGNCVLIAADAAACVGNLDARFEHAMGDIDYGLRARAKGVGLWLAPGVMGTCSDNPPTGTYRDRRFPLRQRCRLMFSRKGLPWRSWLTMTRRHAGLLWPVAFIAPYLKVTADALWHDLQRLPAGDAARTDGVAK